MSLAPAFEAVPAELVHKRAAAGVLLNGWRRTGERTHQVIARWPRADGFYTRPDGRPDPMLHIESVRQCLPLLSHAAFGVPLEHHLVWESFRCTLGPGAPDPERPLDEVEIDVHCDEVRIRGTRVTALALSFTVRQDTAILATAHTRFTVQIPPVYQRLRGDRVTVSSANHLRSALPEPLGARAVGRLAESDVLLSATARRHVWRLRVNPRHPVFFDHPVDHVPGALLLGAALQAAHATAHSHQIVEINGRFSRFVEFADPCTIVARLPLDTSPCRKQVEVAFLQPGQGSEPAFSATVTLSPAASGRAVPGSEPWRSRSRCR